MSNEVLRACPFCGSTDVEETDQIVATGITKEVCTSVTAVECYGCGCRGPVAENVKGWNDRTGTVETSLGYKGPDGQLFLIQMECPQ